MALTKIARKPPLPESTIHVREWQKYLIFITFEKNKHCTEYILFSGRNGKVEYDHWLLLSEVIVTVSLNQPVRKCIKTLPRKDFYLHLSASACRLVI